MNIHPQLIILDFDRTLSDVEASMDHFYQAAEACGIDTQAIIDARKLVENDGGSFDPYSYVQKALGKKSNIFDEHFIANAANILFPDAERFLKKLEKQKMPHIVLTYGVNSHWQTLKLQASGYRGPHIVLDHAEKGKLISEWQKGSNSYTVTILGRTFLSKSVLLIDDKVVAFNGMPQNGQGFLLQRHGQLLPGQKGDLLNTISRITSFDELSIVEGLIKKV